MSQLTKVFSVNRKGFSLPAGVAIGGVLLVIWFAIAQLGQQKYVVSVIFAVLTTALSDPGGGYWKRARGMGAFGLGGAAVTALAFSSEPTPGDSWYSPSSSSRCWPGWP